MSVLADFLKQYHRGERAAITANELTGNGWGNARSIRRSVHEARVLGLPICSSAKGYFYPDNEFEKKLCKKRLVNMGKGIFKATKALVYTETRQLSLFDGY